MNAKLALLSAGILALAASAPAAMIDDFSTSTWDIGGGGGANIPGSSFVRLSDTPAAGQYAAQFTYAHTTAVGFDYVDFYRFVAPVDISAGITLQFKAPWDADNDIAIQFFSNSSGWFEHVFTPAERDGAWHTVTLPIGAGLIPQTGTSSATDIGVIRFRSFGDKSAVDYSNAFFVSGLQTIPEPALLGPIAVGAVLMLRRRK